MKSTKSAWMIAIFTVLLTFGAFAQVSQTSAASMRGMALRGALSLSQSGAASTIDSNVETQPEVPALTLTWGIYTFPGTVGSFNAGINKFGHIIGGYGPNTGLNLPSNHGFLLKGTKFTKVDYPGAGWTQPNDINDSGLIVGAYGASLSDLHGFKLGGTTYTSIDYPGATGTFALGVNKLGDIVGLWYSPSNPCCPSGFLLSGGVFTNINYPGAVYTAPFGINKTGEIVGFYGDSSGETHGFTLVSGTYSTFDYPGYSQNYIADINDNGLIVGGYGDLVTINGVTWQWEHCYTYQSGAFTTFDAPFGPPAASGIWHVSSNGVISGYYLDNTSTSYGFEATVGP
jgi:hypothetical protein